MGSAKKRKKPEMPREMFNRLTLDVRVAVQGIWSRATGNHVEEDSDAARALTAWAERMIEDLASESDMEIEDLPDDDT